MDELFASGTAVDIALGVLAIEALILGYLKGRGAFGGIAVALLPGMCLLLALRAALTGADWLWIALWLGAALPAHVADLLRRRV